MSTQKIDTTVELCGITLPNPVIPASGTFAFGYEMANWYDINILGGISLKGTTLEPRFGNPTPRIAECHSGMLNAVGLQNPGVDEVIRTEIPKLRKLYNGAVIANISGFSLNEYVEVSKKFDNCSDVDLLEINISCPNVHGGGLAFGTSCESARQVTEAVKSCVKKPVLVKLSPNVTSIADIAKSCEDAGADGLVLINTLLGLRLDPRTGKPIVSTGACGFSGPAIKPVALRMVYEVSRAVDIPIIGVGGILDADDVLEFVSAGATAVQVGSQNLVDPYACKTIIETLAPLMGLYGIQNFSSIRGRAHK